jgi:fumarate reductase flavoprotein subunit
MVLNVPPNTKLERIDKPIREKSSSGSVKIANDWPEISGWMSISASVLEKTVETYNSLCMNRQDSMYYKNPDYLMAIDTPPFYAIECHASYLGTLGGVKINQKMEAISTAGNPIPGLYAAGQDAGGWVSSSYNIRLPGTTCGFAVNSGRIAGEAAAEYVSSGRFRV